MSLHTRQTPRRFKLVTLLDGTQVRLRSLQRSEQRKWKNVTAAKGADQFSDDVLLAMCICNEHGDQIISCDDALTGIFDSWDMAECQLLLRGAFELCFPDTGVSSKVVASLKNSKETGGSDSSPDDVTPTAVLAMNCT